MAPPPREGFPPSPDEPRADRARPQAASTIEYSICSMVTGSWLTPRTQPDSQGAGQSLPVKSGKLLVAWRRSIASGSRSRRVRSFHSGMRLPRGQEKWQKGTPQSMHREAWRFRSAEPSARLSRISFQSRMRTSTGRSAGSSRLR